MAWVGLPPGSPGGNAARMPGFRAHPGTQRGLARQDGGIPQGQAVLHPGLCFWGIIEVIAGQ